MKFISLLVSKANLRPLKKARKGRRRCRLKGGQGRGTLEKEKPPIFGVIQRGGEVVTKMLANIQQKPIQPIIQATVSAGALIYMDEYDIHARLEAWGYTHRSGCHSAVANMLVTKMAMAFVKFMSTGWKDFGHCCALGSGPIGVSLKRSCRFTLASSSSFTMLEKEGKPR